MSRKQQSLTGAAKNNTVTDSNTATTDSPTQTTDKDPRLELGEVYNLIEEETRIPFLGLENHVDAEYPDHVNKASPMYDDDPVSFTDVIKLLPEAEEGNLTAVNEYVNNDGTVDEDAIENIAGIDPDQLSIDPSDITNADKHVAVHDYKDIIDPRRKALNALGCDVKFRWQIATDSYSIINPRDAYYPAYKTFKKEGETDTIFGWVDIDDWGGRVNMYIFFTDHTIDHPESDENDCIYVGLHTGYDFSGGRALDVKLFGYDPTNDVRFYSLGQRRSRRHVGDPNNPEHERKQGRTPIDEWWEKEYENLIVWTDDLIDDIERATATTIDFSNFRFDIEDFYSHLDIPQSYIEETDGGIGAVKRARRHSPSSSTYTMWTLFYALSRTLEDEFQGTDHAGSAYKVYADIATKILRSPYGVIERAKREHDYQQQKADSGKKKSKRDQLLEENQDIDEVDSVTDLDGVDTEDNLDLIDKRNIAQKRQEKLFNFE